MAKGGLIPLSHFLLEMYKFVMIGDDQAGDYLNLGSS